MTPRRPVAGNLVAVLDIEDGNSLDGVVVEPIPSVGLDGIASLVLVNGVGGQVKNLILVEIVNGIAILALSTNLDGVAAALSGGSI